MINLQETHQRKRRQPARPPQTTSTLMNLRQRRHAPPITSPSPRQSQARNTILQQRRSQPVPARHRLNAETASKTPQNCAKLHRNGQKGAPDVPCNARNRKSRKLARDRQQRALKARENPVLLETLGASQEPESIPLLRTTGDSSSDVPSSSIR